MASISQKIKEEEKDDGGIDEIISHVAACHLTGVMNQEEKLNLSQRAASQLSFHVKEEKISLSHTMRLPIQLSMSSKRRSLLLMVSTRPHIKTFHPSISPPTM